MAKHDDRTSVPPVTDPWAFGVAFSLDAWSESWGMKRESGWEAPGCLKLVGRTFLSRLSRIPRGVGQ